ncbi:hypothetical protein MKW92_012733, partial [Papaver armeniacum]
YMRKLKSYVRNKACPEGSMAEAYLIEESLTMLTRYLNSTETKFNRVSRNEDYEQPPSHEKLVVFRQSGRPVGAETFGTIEDSEMQQIQLYALQNTAEVEPYE